MKDDDIWKPLYYQQYVEDDPLIGQVPVLVDTGIYCSQFNRTCRKNAVHDYVYDDDYYSDYGDDDSYCHGSDQDDDYHDSDDDSDPDGDYDPDHDCTEEDCGLFSSWWKLFRAQTKRRSLDRMYDRIFE